MSKNDKDAVNNRFVYVVTALRNEGDPVSPGIVGVYSTPTKAVENARRWFASISQYYNKGPDTWTYYLCLPPTWKSMDNSTRPKII
eukprot:scaffold51832_cov57-Attheya_sp.AAC.6